MASPIETLFILLKADVSDLKKKFEESEKETDKLKTKLESLSNVNKKTSKSFFDLVSSVSKVVTASAAAVYVISGFKNALDFGIDLSQTSKKLGVSAQDLNAWGNAVELAGGDAKQFQSTLSSLATKFGANPALALKALPLYADLLSKLSPARAQQVGKQLGLDEGTILLLQQGRREIEDVIKRQKELGGVTDADADKYNHYREAIVATNQASERFFNHLARDAIPILTNYEKIKEKAFSYAEKHTAGLEATTAITTGAIGYGILKTFPKVAALAGAAATGVAEAAALYFAVDDLITYFQGGESVTGNAVKYVGKPVQEGFSDILNQALGNIYKFATVGTLTQLPFLGTQNAIGGQQITYNLGPTTINTEATDATGLLADLNKYAGGQFNAQAAQATNYFTNSVAM